MLKNSVKICFLMPTAKNRFQILNLHPKNMYLIKKKIFLGGWQSALLFPVIQCLNLMVIPINRNYFIEYSKSNFLNL